MPKHEITIIHNHHETQINVIVMDNRTTEQVKHDLQIDKPWWFTPPTSEINNNSALQVNSSAYN